MIQADRTGLGKDDMMCVSAQASPAQESEFRSEGVSDPHCLPTKTNENPKKSTTNKK